MTWSPALSMPGVRVVLIGGSQHVNGSPLPSVPAARRSVDALRELLVRQCGVDAAHVRVLHDPAGPVDMGSAITEAANQAESVLLVYYVGHGLVGTTNGELYLATHATDHLTEGLAYKALPYSAVRDALARCRARSMIVVLDCCFSGRASSAYSTAAADGFTASAVRGTHVLTSAAADETALAPPGAEYTAFTGQLLRLLREGDPTRSESLTLFDAYEWLDRELPAHGAPRPRQHTSDTSGQLVLSRNQAFVPATPPPAEPQADVPCPYRGMDRYASQDARYFFGRENAIGELTRLLARSEGPLVLVGPSGSGKSSLLHAGLIPALERGVLPGSARWNCRVLTPGERPATNLTRHLGHALERTVLIVDQFEELFTACDDEEERVEFIRTLTTAGENTLVVLGLRADFYGRCMAYPDMMAALRDNTYLVAPMNDTELRDAIEKPARAGGLTLEPGLTDLILRDLRAGHAEFDTAGALPLLSYALLTTWQRRAGSTLTLAGYQAGGGIWDSVTRRAEATYGALPPTAQEVARRILLRMVHLNTDADHTRRRVPTAELTDRADAKLGIMIQVLDAFARERLITVDAETVTITHESLLRAWPRLRQWIERDSADLVIHQQIRDAAERWERLDRDDGLLYRGRALAEAELWREARDNERELSSLDREFLDASSAERRTAAEDAERQRARERRQNRRLRLLTTGLTLLVVVAVVASVIAGLQARSAVEQRTAAEEQQHVATARLLVSQAESARASDPHLALQLGIAAERIHPDPQTRASLVGTLTSTRYAGRITGLGDDRTAVAFSPGNDLLATGHTVRTQVREDQADGSNSDSGGIAFPEAPSASDEPASPRYVTKTHTAITLWTARGPGAPNRAGTPITINDAAASFLVFAPDGRVLVTSGENGGTLAFWDVSDPARPGRLGTLDAGEFTDIHAVAYSPDGRILATIEEDSLALWDVTEQARARRLSTQPTAQAARPYSIAFSPDSLRIATGSEEEVVLWDVTDPAHPRTVNAPLPAREPVMFSPSGTILATHDKGGDNANAYVLWDLRRPGQPQRLGTMGGNNNAMAFSPDGNTAATTGFDGAATLWDVRNPDTPTKSGDPLVGHTSSASQIAFSPDGGTLATLSVDGSVILWDLTDRGQPTQVGESVANVDSLVFPPNGRTLVAGGSEGVMSLRELAGGARQRTLARDLRGLTTTISPDGRMLAVGGTDGATTLWNVSDPTRPARLARTEWHRGVPLMFSPNGRLLLTGDKDASYLFDVSDPKHPIRRLKSLPASIVLAAAFSPDSRTLAVANIYDTKATLWNVTNPKKPRERAEHLPVGAFTNITGLAFSPDSEILATGRADGKVTLWDVSRPETPTRLGQPLTGPNPENQDLLAIAGSSAAVIGMAFSTNGRILATANNEATLILWDVTNADSGTRLGPPVPLPTEPALSVKFSRDGRTLAAIGFDNKATVWDVSDVVNLLAHAAETACAIVGKSLDEATWRRYVPGLDYQNTCA